MDVSGDCPSRREPLSDEGIRHDSRVRRPDPYRVAARVYDLATLTWSGGAIWRSRRETLRDVSPHERVLIPGAGTGRLALEAAARGALVVALEPSPAMRRRFEERMSRASAEIAGRVELRPTPLSELGTDEHFDLVVAEHFLNVFAPDEMPNVRERLIAAVAPGGTFAVADFAPLGGPAPSRLAQRVHHRIPLTGCALLTRNALHPIYDHGRDLEGHVELAASARRDFRSFGFGPAWWSAWTFRRVSDSDR